MSTTQTAGAAPGMSAAISAMPFLARDPESVWSRAMALRDRIYNDVEQTCRNLGIETLVNKSIDFSFPAWVSLEAWLPAGAPDSTYRMFATISIEPKPYSRFEFEVTLHYERDGKTRTRGPLAPPSSDFVAEWVRFLLGKGRKPSVRPWRIRRFGWQLWYPRNKLSRLRRDVIGLIGVLALGVAIGFASIQPIVTAIGGAIALICLFVVWRRRKTVVINAGRPVAQPRTLRLVDSWQTMVNDLGRSWQEVRGQLFRRLEDGLAFNIHSRLENISYLTPDGKQERQQLVLSQGRGVVFCHVYPYGDDLFVGWDSYVNYGQWVERKLASGFDSTLRKASIINTVTPGISRITEYDLIDVNSLTEWTHSRITQVLKTMLAEHKLDQEIDFKIVRGERQTLLAAQPESRKEPRFRRGSLGDRQPG